MNWLWYLLCYRCHVVAFLYHLVLVSFVVVFSFFLFFVTIKLLFAFRSILCRIYWYPTKVMYSTIHTVTEAYPGAPIYLYLNTMIIAVYAMQVSGYA